VATTSWSIPAHEYHTGATLAVVTGCVTTREAATEIVSVALFRRAHEAGVIITRRWVDEQLDWLRAHEPTCRCAEPCGLAGQLPSGSQVYWLAAGWQRQARIAAIRGRR
jgi:hypothetical protein